MACRIRLEARIESFDTSCFSGEYVTGDVSPEYLSRLEAERSDAAKAWRRASELRDPPRTTLGWRDVVTSFRLKLWDPERGEMVGFPAK